MLTERQEAFIRRLITEREGGEIVTVSRLDRDAGDAYTKGEASALIDVLLGNPHVTHHHEESGIVVQTDLRPGLYTVVLEDGSHVTLRLKDATTWAKDLPEGSLISEFLAGPDNESRNCAYRSRRSRSS